MPPPRRPFRAESLEKRLLLSMSAALSVQPVTTAGSTMQSFTVTYTDPAGISTGSIGPANLTVTGSDGLTMELSYVTVNENSGPTAEVVYTANAPGGSFVPDGVFAGTGTYSPYSAGTGHVADFTPDDNGAYTVSLNAGSVKDNSGAYFPAGPIGTFAVSISAESTTEAQFTRTVIDPTPGKLPDAKALIDIYGNGYEEPIVAHHDNTGIYYYQPESWSDPTGPWIKHTIGPGYTTAGNSVSFEPGDFTGDGLTDLVTAPSERDNDAPYAPPGGLVLWIAPADPFTTTWTPITIDSSYTDVHKIDAADINGDGNLDLVVSEQEQSVNQRIAVFYNLGGGLAWQEQILANTGAQNQRVGDITDNGLLDIFDSNHGYYGAPVPIEAWLQDGPAITSAPAAPDDLFASAYGYSQITLNWTDTSGIENGYQNPLGFDIERSTDDEIFTTIATVGVGTFTYADTSALPDTPYYYRVVATNATGASAYSDVASASIAPAPAPTPGSITGTAAAAAASYNLTTLGTTDWAHWGRGGNASNFDHDATGGSQISNVTKLSSGSYGGYTYSARDVTWTNGAPTASDSGDHGYIWANNAIGAGYSFTVPASTATQTLYIYLGGASSGGTLTANLSDGSATPYAATFSGTSNYQDAVAITYNAATAGQTLTLTYTKTQTIGSAAGSVDLIAAWLQ